MKRILFFSIALGSWMAQAANVHIIDGSTHAKTVRVLKGGQRVDIPATELQLDIGAAGGGSAKADILLVHDPVTGLFLWRYQDTDAEKPGGIAERFRENSAVVVKDDRMVEFLLLGSSLWMRESQEKFSTMGDAQRSVMTQIERFGESIKSVVLESYREVNLAEALDVDFLYERGTPHPERSARLREVSAAGSGWRVVLDGPNGDAMAVTIEGREVKGVEAVGPRSARP